MPTPMQAFADVAARYGGVDPTDLEAVRHFYDSLPTLEPERVLAILETLLACEPQVGHEPLPPSYPPCGKTPALADSPEARIPFFAAGWRERVRRLLRRSRTSGRS